jgi:hypothetical protein
VRTMIHEAVLAHVDGETVPENSSMPDMPDMACGQGLPMALPMGLPLGLTVLCLPRLFFRPSQWGQLGYWCFSSSFRADSYCCI